MLVYVGKETFKGYDEAGSATGAVSLSVGPGFITLIPTDAESKKAAFAALKGDFQPCDTLIVTTGWKNGVLRNILLRNTTIKASVRLCERTMAKNKADRDAYIKAASEKKKADLASLRKTMTACLKGKKLYEDAEKKRKKLLSESKTPEQLYSEAEEMLEKLRAVYPGLYVEIRENDRITPLLKKLGPTITSKEMNGLCLYESLPDISWPDLTGKERRFTKQFIKPDGTPVLLTYDEEICFPETGGVLQSLNILKGVAYVAEPLKNILKSCSYSLTGKKSDMDFREMFPEAEEETIHEAAYASAQDAENFFCCLFNAGYFPKANVDVRCPDVNASEYDFTVKAGEILTGLKCLGDVAEIIENRPYTSAKDLLLKNLRKTDEGYETTPLFVKLVKSGALDSFGDRNSLLDAFGKGVKDRSLNALKKKIEDRKIKPLCTGEAEKRRQEYETLGFTPNTRIGAVEEETIFGQLIKFEKNKATVFCDDGMRDIVVNKSVFSLLGEKVKVCGRDENGVFVATSFEIAPKPPKNLLLRYVSKEDAEFVQSLGKEAINSWRNPVRVAVLSWEKETGVHTGLVFYYFTQEAVEKCRKHGIKFADSDRD